MAAFDKIPSGLAQMDDVLDSIRPGDNVVWQISEREVDGLYLWLDSLSNHVIC